MLKGGWPSESDFALDLLVSLIVNQQRTLQSGILRSNFDPELFDLILSPDNSIIQTPGSRSSTNLLTAPVSDCCKVNCTSLGLNGF